jgi:hypothetical protein
LQPLLHHLLISHKRVELGGEHLRLVVGATGIAGEPCAPVLDCALDGVGT